MFAPSCRRRRLVPLLCLLAAVHAGTGCARERSLQVIDDDSGMPRAQSTNPSYVRSGETVALRLITHEQWARTYQDELGVNLPPELPPLDPDGPEAERFMAVAADLVAGAVGLVIDIVKEQLKKEAAKHEQQYKQSIYADDFWKDPGLSRYAAFELVRRANGYDTDDRPAFRLVCALVPSRHDRRIFLIRPVYLKVNAAAAKVSRDLSGGRRFTIQMNTVLRGAAVGADGSFEQKDLADATFLMPGYDLDTAPELRATFVPSNSDDPWDGEWTNVPGDKAGLKDHVAGFFRAPMPPLDASVRGEVQAAHTMVKDAAKEFSRLLDHYKLPPETQPAAVRGDPRADLASAAKALEAAIRLRDRPRWYTTDRGGAFRLFVAVTETDDSRAKETLLKFSEFVGSQKDPVVKKVKEQFEGDTPPPPPGS